MVEGITATKCVSKAGSKLSKQFYHLRSQLPGQLSVLKHHEATYKEMQEKDSSSRVREESLKAQGRLRSLNSDFKRANKYYSVKQRVTIDEELLNQHKKTMKREFSNLMDKDPIAAQKVKIDYSLPKLVETFKSPSRSQLQDYEQKEERENPNPASYRPRFSYVLKQNARPASLLKPQAESPARMRKQAQFEKW